ncbi:MAG: LysR family transcriptional regulator [Gammaproteobacteria bacterium]
MTFDPRLLRHFTAVAREGSLGRAAETLSCTQPALSRAIQRLEEQLGAVLFERRTTGMVLTPFGQALLPYANLLETESRHAMDEIAALQGLNRGRVRIGAVASAAVSLVPGAVQQLLRQWPGIQVSIMEDVVERLTTALAANEIDLVIASNMPPADEVEKVFDCGRGDTSLVIARPGHPVLEQPEVSLQSLLQWHWIMPGPGTGPRRYFDTAFEQRGWKPSIAVETRSLEVMKSLIAGTDLLGWLPEPIIEAERSVGRLATLPVPELSQHRLFSVYRRKRGFMAPAINRFLNELKKMPDDSS